MSNNEIFERVNRELQAFDSKTDGEVLLFIGTSRDKVFFHISGKGSDIISTLGANAAIHETFRRILLRVAGCIQDNSFMEEVKKKLESNFNIKKLIDDEYEP